MWCLGNSSCHGVHVKVVHRRRRLGDEAASGTEVMVDHGHRIAELVNDFFVSKSPGTECSEFFDCQI